jgi:rod shape-determining protein MreB
MALDLAIDLGTSHARLASLENGLLLDEPTAVAIDTKNGAVVAVGYEALDVVGRMGRHIATFRPMSQGATTDFDVTARLVRGLFDRAGLSSTSRARLVMSVPVVSTAIERRALKQAAIQAGAKEVMLIEAPIAGAIGAGLPIQEAVGSAVVTLGAGASEVGIISLGGIVTVRSMRQGGETINAKIAELFRLELGVVVAPPVVESLKIQHCSAMSSHDSGSVLVHARTVEKGEAVEVAVASAMLHRAAYDVMDATARMLQECFANTPPDLTQDVANFGMTLIGGHAQIRHGAEFLEERTGVRARSPHDPDLTVLTGLTMCLEDASMLRSVYQRRVL